MAIYSGGTIVADATNLQSPRLTGALPAISGASLTGIDGNKITVADWWYLASSTTAGTDGVIADSSGAGGGDWTIATSMTGTVTTVTTGSGGGKFSFPTTGHYLINVNFSTYHNTDDNDMGIVLKNTVNDFSSVQTKGYIRNTFNSTDGTPNAYQQASNTFILDITDVANDKFRLDISSTAANNYIYGADAGGDGKLGTTCLITRIGDT